jgi:molybdenum cofactor biosynthesis protein B
MEASLTLRIALLTVSDTRTAADDVSGDTAAQRLETAGHVIAARTLLRDDVVAIRTQVAAWVQDPQIDIVVTTGGTGLAARDVTPEAIAPLVTRSIPGFGELFRALSYEEIGTSTIQSRADAAQCEQTFVFMLPGSPGAVRTAMDRILIEQLDSRHRPCNFAQFVPRTAK